MFLSALGLLPSGKSVADETCLTAKDSWRIPVPSLEGKSEKDIQCKKRQIGKPAFSLLFQVTSSVTHFCDTNLLFQATVHACGSGGDQNVMLQRRKFCNPQ